MQPVTHPPLLTRNLSERPSNFTLAGIPEIPFYGREFDVVMHTCPSAICGCDSFTLFLYMPNLLGTKHYSFRIQGNATEQRFDLDDSSENSGLAARMLELYLTPADWDSIEQEWRLSKAMLIEHLDPKCLDFSVEFPENHRREPSKLMTFNGVFSLSYPYQASFREKEFALLDLYCINSECRCTKAMFSFATSEKEFFSFRYDYRNRDIEIPSECEGDISMAEAFQVVENLNARFPGFDKYIENRNQVLRALNAADLKKRPLAKPAFFEPPVHISFPPIVTSVGRNALCPCGSGKKYKRCCGK